jgi:hypothetical protein
VNHLSQKSDPMPDSLIDLLMSMSGNMTNARSTMETALADERTRQHDALDEAYWSMLEYEDDTYGTSDYISLLEKMNTFNSECAIVELLMQDGQWKAALVRAQNIPNLVDLTKSTKREYVIYLPWVSLLGNIHLSGRDLNAMTASEFQQLETIAQKFDTYAAVAAQEVLNQWNDTHYFVPPAFGKRGQVRTVKNQNTVSNFFVEAFPNPANFMLHLRIKYPLPTSQNCTLIVSDIFGKETIRISLNPQLSEYVLDTTNLANGLYLYNIIIPDSTIQIDGKFEVLR